MMQAAFPQSTDPTKPVLQNHFELNREQIGLNPIYYKSMESKAKE